MVIIILVNYFYIFVLKNLITVTYIIYIKKKLKKMVYV